MPTASEYRKNKVYYDNWNKKYLLVPEHRKEARERASSWYDSHKFTRQITDRIAYLRRCGLPDHEIAKAVKEFKKKSKRCAICKIKILNRWCGDHDHKRKVFRGILCLKCNSAIGFFRDNLKILLAAIRYLEGGR
jgi:Recombination endonuclease VII